MTASTDQPDAMIWQALRQGDKTALEFIYRRYAREIYSYIRKNIQRKEDCEELIQDIFESLWVRRGELDVRSPIPAYLLGMARHKIIRYFRKNALVKKYRDHFLLFEAVYDQAEEDMEINHAAIQDTLAKVIKELPERCQEALKLRLSEDLSNRDIARRMNISTRTVEGYMFRAFNHIRASYKQYASHVSLAFPLISILFGGD